MIDRRRFLSQSGALAAATATWGIGTGSAASGDATERHVFKVKLSCNLYSFNDLLRSREMTLEEVFGMCAELGFDAVDPTGYYFPGYPDSPDDAFVYQTKKQAFLLGLDISGTGVRNDFTTPEQARREDDVNLVKRWIEVAAKMDAPVLRVFAGHAADPLPPGHTDGEVLGWVVDAIKTCVDYGQSRGVMIGMQNHNGFLKTADQVLHVRERVNADWFGLIVDIGSLRTGDPYEEIARLAPYACTWQIKENVYRRGVEEKTDVVRIVEILRDAQYRGYLPIETLGGDPRVKLPRFLDEIRNALA